VSAPLTSYQIALHKPTGSLPVGAEEDRNVEVDDDGKNGSENGVGAVSYTHLTLPTSDLV